MPIPSPSVAAIVDTAREPMLVLDADHRVLAANRAFREAFQLDPDHAAGRRIHELRDGEWDTPDLRELLDEQLPARGVVVGHRIEHDLGPIGRRTLLVNARALEGDAAAASLVVLAF